MFLTIYNIYLDSAIFIRKNIFVLLPYIFNNILYLSLNKWLTENSLPERMIRAYVPLLLLCFLEMCVVVIVYKRESIITSGETILQLLNRFSGSVLLLTVYWAFVLGVYLFISTLLFFKIPAVGRLIGILGVFIFIASYPLSLRHLIYHNNIMVMDSIKAGFKELYKNFVFYFLIALSGIVISFFPSLLMPSSWFALPVLPLVETGSRYINAINWVGLLLSPILSTLTSVALTYAFISKNNKTKNVS